MPVMNGHEACQTMRGQPWGRNMRIIALSGWGQQSEVERSRSSGFDQHFVKPISFQDLKGVLEG
jgi:CheY-like chemotaxis protein